MQVRKRLTSKVPFSQSVFMTVGESSISKAEIEKLNKLLGEYLPKLIKRIDSLISGKYSRKFDSEDVAMTVCRTMLRRFKEGKFRLGEEGELWALMLVIARRKISNKVRAENTKGRSIEKEVYGDPQVELFLSREPGPEDAAGFIDLLRNLESNVNEECLSILNQRLEGYSNREISEKRGCSEKQITRKLKLLQDRLKKML